MLCQIMPERTNAIIFLAFSGAMASAIFMPNYSELININRFGIGIIGFAYGIAIFVSSYHFGRVSDYSSRKKLVSIGLALATLFYFLQIFAGSALILFTVRFFAGFSMGIFIPALTAYTYDTGGKLGNFSSYGSLGWAFGSLISGAVAQLGRGYFHEEFAYKLVFITSSLLFLIAFFISINLPDIKFKAIRVPLFPLNLVRRNSHIYIANFLRNLGANAIWIIFPLYLMTLGANPAWIGIIYLVNTVSQFIIMNKLDSGIAERFVAFGLTLSTFVFLTFTLVPNFLFFLPVQIALAASYSLVSVGSLRYLAENNREKATSVGILSSSTSLAIALGPLIGGAISQLYSFKATMYFAAITTAVGLIIYLNGFYYKRASPDYQN